MSMTKYSGISDAEIISRITKSSDGKRLMISTVGFAPHEMRAAKRILREQCKTNTVFTIIGETYTTTGTITTDVRVEAYL